MWYGDSLKMLYLILNVISNILYYKQCRLKLAIHMITPFTIKPIIYIIR